jgi:hypothetical protein
MMNIRAIKIWLVILMLLVALLLLGGGALAQPGVLQSAVERGVASGGGYRLASALADDAQGPGWRVEGSASGGGYVLQALQAPILTGSGCCCTYLPCVIR